jgi:ubiquitin carboxyl-terminal hydrolase 36/42
MESKGLFNIGNTCYMNSCIQILVHNTDLCKLIETNQHKSNKLKPISDLIDNYHNPTVNNVINPIQIKKLLESKNSDFRGFNQHDAGDCLMTLLDYIKDELKTLELFEIKTKYVYKCKLAKCLNKSEKIETNPMLILPMKETDKTLDDCYRNYKVHEKLEGENMYFCEKCNKKRIGTKRITIAEWPTNLLIWLKRFNNNLKKLEQDVNIPLLWRHNYELKGFICHTGNSIKHGHYVAFYKINKVWKYFNDSSVNNISENELSKYLNFAYILYYNKKNI